MCLATIFRAPGNDNYFLINHNASSIEQRRRVTSLISADREINLRMKIKRAEPRYRVSYLFPGTTAELVIIGLSGDACSCPADGEDY